MRKKGLVPPYEITASPETLNKFSGDGMWQCGLKDLLVVLKVAWNKNKTPLLIDMTYEDRQDSKPTSLEIFLPYGGGGGGAFEYEVLDLKMSIIDVNVKKRITWEQLQYEYRSKLVNALKFGKVLTFSMSNTCPPLQSKLFNDERFPSLLFDSKKTQSVRGAFDLEGKWVSKVLNKADDVFAVHEDFNVMAITKFQPADVERFLKQEMRLELFQPIIITSDGTTIELPTTSNFSWAQMAVGTLEAGNVA